MTMNTDEVIDKLATDLSPVRPLRTPGVRAAWWFAGAILYLAALTVARPGFTFELNAAVLGYLLIQSVGVVAGVLAAMAALASVVPGYSSRLSVWALVAGFAWLTIMAVVAVGADANSPILAAQHEWLCVAFILVGGAPLVAALSVMLRRGAPLSPVRTGLFTALAVGLLANFAACLSAPHVADPITLIWHGGALLALILVCAAGAPAVLRWDRLGWPGPVAR